MRAIVVGFVAYVAIGVGASVSAVAQQPAPPPVWKPGEICVSNHFTILDKGTQVNKTVEFRQEVIGLSGGVVSLSVVDGDNRVTRTLTLEGNALSYADMTWAPAFPTFKFPLQIGEAWSGNSVQQVGNRQTVTHSVSARVAAHEKVTVPAGTFDAYRIDIDAPYKAVNANGTSGSGTSKRQSWYSQAQGGRVVKSTYTSTGWDGKAYADETYELTGCK